MAQQILQPPQPASAGHRWQLYTGVILSHTADNDLSAPYVYSLSIPLAGDPPIVTLGTANPIGPFVPTDPTALWSFAGILRYGQVRMFVNRAPDEQPAVEPDKVTGFQHGTVGVGDFYWEQDYRVSAADQIYPGFGIRFTVPQHYDGVVLHASIIKIVGDVWIEVPIGSGLPPATETPTTPGGLQVKPPPFQVDWPRQEVADDFVTRRLGQVGGLTWDRMRWAARRYLLWGEDEEYTAEGTPPQTRLQTVYTFVKLPGLDDAGNTIYWVWETSLWDGAVWGP